MQIVIDREAIIIMYAIALHSIIGGDYVDIKETVTELVDRIAYTILPEGHGRLIDADALLEKQYCIDDSATLSTRDVVNVEDVEDAPTIINADTESNDEWDRVTMIDVNGNTHKVTFKKEIEDIGDYPDEIPNQFDNLTGSMNV